MSRVGRSPQYLRNASSSAGQVDGMSERSSCGALQNCPASLNRWLNRRVSPSSSRFLKRSSFTAYGTR